MISYFDIIIVTTTTVILYLIAGSFITAKNLKVNFIVVSVSNSSLIVPRV